MHTFKKATLAVVTVAALFSAQQVFAKTVKVTMTAMEVDIQTNGALVGGANTMNLMIYVDDVEAHCAKARATGAKIVVEPKTTDYGDGYWSDRAYECEDPGGHHWWFSQRLRSPKS